MRVIADILIGLGAILWWGLWFAVSIAFTAGLIVAGMAITNMSPADRAMLVEAGGYFIVALVALWAIGAMVRISRGWK